MTAHLVNIDRAIGARAAALSNTQVMKVVGPISDIADQWPLFTLCVGTAAVGVTRRDRKLMATGLQMTVSMLAATVLKNIVKDRVDRTRPEVIAEGGSYVFQPGDHDVPELDSFPSGHTAGAVATALVVARQYPAFAVPAIVAATAVAAAQIPRGKHYPSDLIAGAVVGIAANALVGLAMRLVPRSSAIKPKV